MHVHFKQVLILFAAAPSFPAFQRVPDLTAQSEGARAAGSAASSGTSSAARAATSHQRPDPRPLRLPSALAGAEGTIKIQTRLTANLE